MSLRPAPWPLFGTSARRAGQAQPSFRRPELKVLQGGNVRRLERLSPRARLVALISMVGIVLFGVVAFHVVLSQGQFRLERLEARANVEQAQYERLRLQVAQLESPARITAEARNRLGMVPAERVTPVAPKADDMPVSTAGETALATPITEARRDAGEWTNIKPHLSSASK